MTTGFKNNNFEILVDFVKQGLCKIDCVSNNTISVDNGFFHISYEEEIDEIELSFHIDCSHFIVGENTRVLTLFAFKNDMTLTIGPSYAFKKDENGAYTAEKIFGKEAYESVDQ